MQETWKEIQEVEGYLVSSIGRVKSFKRPTPKILSPKTDKDGYHEYGLSCAATGRLLHRRSHRLVALAFIDNTDNLPVINHINMVKNDNRIENLEWCSIAHNNLHVLANQPEKRLGKGFCDLTTIELKEAIEMYKEGAYYIDLNNHFCLEVDQDGWGEILSGRRFAHITGLTEDIRVPRSSSYTKDETIVLSILEKFFINKDSQTSICNDLTLNTSYVSRIVNRKKRVDIYDTFMEEFNANRNRAI